MTPDQIAEVLTPENLATLSSDEVADLVSQISEIPLSDEQAAALAEALSDAPKEVKQAFEEEINVFSGQFDNYVPIGSTIPVGARRVIVAATAVVFTMPTPTTRSRK